MRVGVAVVGGLLAVAGIVLESQAIIWVAIGVLGVAFVLRFFGSPADRSLHEDQEDSTRS